MSEPRRASGPRIVAEPVRGPTIPPLLTAVELAAVLRVAPSTVYRWAQQGRVPHLIVARGAIRFDPAAIRDWLDAASVEPTPEGEEPRIPPPTRLRPVGTRGPIEPAAWAEEAWASTVARRRRKGSE